MSLSVREVKYNHKRFYCHFRDVILSNIEVNKNISVSLEVRHTYKYNYKVYFIAVRVAIY